MTEVRNAGSARRPGHRTLLLETDEGIAAALGEVLHALGHEVHPVLSLSAGVTALRDEAFSLLVVDDVIGADLETLHDLLAVHRRLGVLLLTSSRRRDLPVEPAGRVRLATLRKPFTVPEFARLATELSEQAVRVPRPRAGAAAPRRVGR